MSRLGLFLLGVSGLCILITMLVRTILGGWVNWLFVPFTLFFICLIAGLVVDRLFYKEFLTMRTTKHGANMLTLIFFTVVLLVAVNFIAVRKNLKWDLTSEGLNSVSDQTIKVLGTIKDTAKVTFFYRGGTQGVDQLRYRFKEIVERYKDKNSQIKFQFVDSIKRPGLAQKYGVDKAGAMVFVEYNGKKNQVESLDEQGLTTAFIKVTRTVNKKVAFLTGHGEKSLSDSGPTGASELKGQLESSGYDVSELSLVEKGEVPEDIDLVMILGPKAHLLEAELLALRNYVRGGGELFVAADPGERHNIPLLTKSFGIEFKNDYVLDQFGQVVGASAAMALGRKYGNSGITKDFNPGMMTLFHLATSLQKAPDADSQLKIEKVVETGDTSFTTDQISHGKVEVQTNRRGPHTIAMAVTGGGKETELISIRPARPKGTTLTMTQTNFRMYLLLFIIPLPILFFGLGGFTFYRRRNA